MTVKTRFAPSPTGYLHVGGARVALYCWLFAKNHGGSFILRIEDTDRERSTKEACNAILEGMAWLGLDYEGPFYQTDHFEHYKEVVQQLLDQGHAYRCYCSKTRLEQLRQQQIASKIKPRYDGHCRDLKKHTNDSPFVIRFRNPTSGSVQFDDVVKGPIEIQNKELDDLIIARSDGTPTYNLTVVIDDWDMNITHVIRGDDHINNTPRQINIFNALGLTPPTYCHLPMILGSDGKRLSKRHGAVSVMQYRDDGFLPEALLNYLVRLGWSHGDQEIFSKKEMVEYFDLKHLNNSPAAFNNEKLLWLNQHYLKTSSKSYVAEQLAWHMQNSEVDISHTPSLEAVVATQAERCKTLKEMAEKSRFFYEPIDQYDEKASKKFLTTEIVKPLETIRDRLTDLNAWEKTAIHQVMSDVVEEFKMKFGKLAQPIRIAVSGGTVSPPLDITLELLGRNRTLERLEKAIRWASQD